MSGAIDSPQRAVEAMCAAIRPVGTERVTLERAAGLALAESLRTDRPSPSADVSAMDGYAVSLGASPVRGGSVVPIAYEVRIGQDPGDLPPGACAKIVTGAAIPRGADAVIKREDVHETPDAITVREGVEIEPGAHIRHKGENAQAGALIAEAGAEITPPVAAALAACGVGEPLVHRPLRLALLVTGDELRPLGEAITEYQLRDSNGPTLLALFGPKPWIGAIERARAPDDLAAIGDTLAAMLASADAAIITGGVSMGDHDHVPGALAALGAETLFHKLPQRPGRPMLGAVLDGKPICALPGNPVSVMVTARRIALPALRRLAGFGRDPAPPAVTLDNDDGRSLRLWWHRPVSLTSASAAPGGAGLQPAGIASLIANQGSGDIPGAAGSDGFVEIPPGQSGAGPWPFYAWNG
ncbi:MAG: molybdopterin molybdotransferase MoeA [Phycisphaerales bacterium JB039]